MVTGDTWSSVSPPQRRTAGRGRRWPPKGLQHLSGGRVHHLPVPDHHGGNRLVPRRDTADLGCSGAVFPNIAFLEFDPGCSQPPTEGGAKWAPRAPIEHGRGCRCWRLRGTWRHLLSVLHSFSNPEAAASLPCLGRLPGPPAPKRHLEPDAVCDMSSTRSEPPALVERRVGLHLVRTGFKPATPPGCRCNRSCPITEPGRKLGYDQFLVFHDPSNIMLLVFVFTDYAVETPSGFNGLNFKVKKINCLLSSPLSRSPLS